MASRKQISNKQLDQSSYAEKLARGPETYQENLAFMNRLRAIPFRNMVESEMKRIWRIALRGVSLEGNINKRIRELNNQFLKMMDEDDKNREGLLKIVEELNLLEELIGIDKKVDKPISLRKYVLKEEEKEND